MYGRSRDTLYSFIKWELTFIAVVQVTADYAFFCNFFFDYPNQENKDLNALDQCFL